MVSLPNNDFNDDYDDDDDDDNNNNNDNDDNDNNNNNNRIERCKSRCLQSPHCAANCLQHVRSSGTGAVVCKSRTTHRANITCNLRCATLDEGTAQLLSSTELKSHLF